VRVGTTKPDAPLSELTRRPSGGETSEDDLKVHTSKTTGPSLGFNRPRGGEDSRRLRRAGAREQAGQPGVGAHRPRIGNASRPFAAPRRPHRPSRRRGAAGSIAGGGADLRSAVAATKLLGGPQGGASWPRPGRGGAVEALAGRHPPSFRGVTPRPGCLPPTWSDSPPSTEAGGGGGPAERAGPCCGQAHAATGRRACGRRGASLAAPRLSGTGGCGGLRRPAGRLRRRGSGGGGAGGGVGGVGGGGGGHWPAATRPRISAGRGGLCGIVSRRRARSTTFAPALRQPAIPPSLAARHKGGLRSVLDGGKHERRHEDRSRRPPGAGRAYRRRIFNGSLLT